MWLVTGASGFVGGRIFETLGERGRACGRREWADLPRALEGADGLVHAASIVHRPGTPESEYVDFNVEGTRRLLDAARAAGVRRFVFISSIKVNGEEPAGVIDERSPIRAEAAYARTKAEAEALVLARSELHPIVLRLCPVYGRGDKGNVRMMIRAIARRRFVIPGDGSTRKSIVHVSTVARAARAALSSDAGGVFVVADRPAPSIRELAGSIARQLGQRAPRSISPVALKLVAGVVGATARLAGVKTGISRSLIEKSMTSSICDPGRIERELGVTCATDVDASLADEIAWLRGLGEL